MDRKLHRVCVVKSSAGFSLLETLVAITLLTVGVCSLAQLFVISARANQRAHAITTASVLAQQKMEQLRALMWGVDDLGRALTDTTSDTTTMPERPAGGVGLSPSPGNTLAMDTPGYCDFVDAFGELVDAGAGPSSVPAASVYTRRWSITRVPANPDNTIVVQVRVIATTPWGQGESASIVGVRTRRGA
jgi:type II secretory pathway pseudopilin PulG